jgi:hypothetical protein
MKFLINFATRSRPSKYHACIKNLRECFTDYKVLLKVDRDDPYVRDYFETVYEEVIIKLGYSESKVHAINRDIPADGWDVLINTSDDVQWLKIAGSVIEKSAQPDLFLHFPEAYAESQAKKQRRPSTCVVSIMDRIYYNRFGYVYNPEYISLYCDNEATEVARKLGRYKFVPIVICEHLHPVTGKVKTDDQYRYTQSFAQEDKTTFIRRRNFNFK